MILDVSLVCFSDSSYSVEVGICHHAETILHTDKVSFMVPVLPPFCPVEFGEK